MRNRNLIVGMFLAAGVALFTLALFLIGNQHRAFAHHVVFYTQFTRLDGLIKGAKVRVAGYDAGEVMAIEVPTTPAQKFRVRLKIEEKAHGLVRSDSFTTIATEGLVGDRFVQIHPGSAGAPLANAEATLQSKDPPDMEDLMAKSADLLRNASSTLESAGTKVDRTLDILNTTVTNANDVVSGLKRGKGTIGMLLADQTTADDIRQVVREAQQAGGAISHASNQADAIVTDLNSRNLGQKVDEVMESAQDATRNLQATSQKLSHTLDTALGPDDKGVRAGENIRQSLANLGQATSNMAVDTEALKHEFFFRGFFKNRGYYSLGDLAPGKYRSSRLFGDPANSRVWLSASDLFERQQAGPEVLSSVGQARIDQALASLGENAVEGPLVVEGYSDSSQPGEQIALSRSRATLVRNYLHDRFRIDLAKIGFVGLSGTPPSFAKKPAWDGVSLLLVKGR